MNRHHLQPFEQLEGILMEIILDENLVSAVISGYLLIYCRSSPKARDIVENLTIERMGQRFGIINIEDKLRFRWPDENPLLEGPSEFWKWYCITYGFNE
jgi:hypothetical protein